MKGIYNHSFFFASSFVLGTIALVIFALGCGGGGGSGSGGSHSNDWWSGDGIYLDSITYPKYTDLSGASKTPPPHLPLSQQVVFTFSGPIQGDITPSSVIIYSQPGQGYTGPEVAVDYTKNLIYAKGTMEVMDNLLVFTPYMPLSEPDFSSYALAEDVPGLLPDQTYKIFVPVGLQGAIANLTTIAPDANHPTSFTTLNKELTSLYFANQPSLPPLVTSTVPADGAVDIPIQTKSDLSQGVPGFPQNSAIQMVFDQPLRCSEDNLEGMDHDGDGVREQNLFLAYSDLAAYAAVDTGSLLPGYVAKLKVDTGDFEVVGFTRTPEGDFVGLQSLLFTKSHALIGVSSDKIYDVDHENPVGAPPTPVCNITNERDLPVGMDVRGLCRSAGYDFFALDVSNDTLVQLVIPDAGDVEATELGSLSPAGGGRFVDLMFGPDDELYGLGVIDPGTPFALCSIERIDRETMAADPVVTGLSGDFTSLGALWSDRILLYESQMMQWVHLDRSTGQILESHLIDGAPVLKSGEAFDFDCKRFELGCTPTVLENSYQGSRVSLAPSGILPMGARVDLMVRNAFENVSFGSMHNNFGDALLGSRSVASFKTYDPGPAAVADHYLEDFLDNVMEERSHDLSFAPAVWNIMDTNGVLPDYSHLVAGLGLTGSGELGDFKPFNMGGVEDTVVHLDTDYQPLPLYNGATPGVLKPIVVKGGEFHFHEIIIPEGVLISATGSKPLIMTATGRVEIAGTIDVSGDNGTLDPTYNSAFIPNFGGSGGAGGGKGGMGQPPVPEDFSAMTDLQSPIRGEQGWGPGNKHQIGGEGGESGCSNNPPWDHSSPTTKDRGGGGGGGTYLQEGHMGYIGAGRFGINEEGEYVKRDKHDWWDGSYQEDPVEWIKNNDYIDIRDPHGGLGGEAVFDPDNPDNRYIGFGGALTAIQGGQGGGGGGSRLDSKNKATIALALTGGAIPYARCKYDAKGGGGGGGGGAVAIHSLEDIVITATGAILAEGGWGGGGETVGASTSGAGGGGGSGGAILLNSAKNIIIEADPVVEELYGRLSVKGGWGADALDEAILNSIEMREGCKIKSKNGGLIKKQYCTYNRAEGGYGGHGLIQLMVKDPAVNIQMDGWPDGDLKSVKAVVCEIQKGPEYPKRFSDSFKEEYAWYAMTIVQDPVTLDYSKYYPTTTDCLVDTEKSKTTLNTITYGVSKWIDLGRIVDRPSLMGQQPPFFWVDNLGFEGIHEESGWGVVTTSSGYVVNPTINDIQVEAPDAGMLPNYIDPTNEVAIQFQATDALVPGSKVPDEDPAKVSESTWTHDLSSLNGKQFIRFRVRLDAAVGGELAPDVIKPQVNEVRLRFKY